MFNSQNKKTMNDTLQNNKKYNPFMICKTCGAVLKAEEGGISYQDNGGPIIYSDIRVSFDSGKPVERIVPQGLGFLDYFFKCEKCDDMLVSYDCFKKEFSATPLSEIREALKRIDRQGLTE